VKKEAAKLKISIKEEAAKLKISIKWKLPCDKLAEPSAKMAC
jgi:hypothetical protein